MDRLAVMVPGEVYIPVLGRSVPGWRFLPSGPRASESFLRWPGGRTPFSRLLIKCPGPEVRRP